MCNPIYVHYWHTKPGWWTFNWEKMQMTIRHDKYTLSIAVFDGKVHWRRSYSDVWVTFNSDVRCEVIYEAYQQYIKEKAVEEVLLGE